MTKPTDYDAAGVSQETAGVIAELENLAAFLDEMGFMKDVARVESAIDRLIVLDHAAHLTTKSDVCGFLGNEFINTTTGRRWKFDGKSWTEIHPRERALHQDAKRGNFRHTKNNDNETDGA